MCELSKAIQASKRHRLVSLASFVLEAIEEARERGEEVTEDTVYRAIEAWAQEIEDHADVT